MSSMTQMRIEATYLVSKLPADIDKYKHEKIKQGYLVDTLEAARIRKKGGSLLDYS